MAVQCWAAWPWLALVASSWLDVRAVAATASVGPCYVFVHSLELIGLFGWIQPAPKLPTTLNLQNMLPRKARPLFSYVPVLALLCFRCFVDSFFLSFVHSFVRCFVRSLFRAFVRSFASFVVSFVRSFSFVGLFSFVRSVVRC